MISLQQKILLKRAQREAALDDTEYRDALNLVSGCRSSTDPQMTNRHLDFALAYLEAIHWRKVDAGELQPACSPAAVFRHRGHWAAKNRSGNTSRDRYTGRDLAGNISDLEKQLQTLGFDRAYCLAIEKKVTRGRTDDYAAHLYRAALVRTLRSKMKVTTSA